MDRDRDHSDKPKQHGDKTHEQFLRTVERKDDLPKPGEPELAFDPAKARRCLRHTPRTPGRASSRSAAGACTRRASTTNIMLRERARRSIMAGGEGDRMDP